MTGGWRLVARLAAAAVLLAILAITLTPDGDRLAPQDGEPWCLVCGVRGGADIVRNVLLFLPLGATLVLAGVRPPLALGVAVLTTLGIEVAQVAVVGGRSGTASDVVANSLGALLGVALAAGRRTLLRPAPAQARRLAAGAGVGFAAAAAAGAWLVTPASVPAGTHAMASLRGNQIARAYEGHIHRSTLNGRPVVCDGGVVAPFPLVRPPDALRVEATVSAMLPPGLLRSFAHAFAPDGRDVFVVGQRQRHLVLRVRQNAGRLRLDNMQFELRDAFPAAAGIPRGTDPRRGGVVRVEGALRDGRVQLRAERAGDARAWSVPLSPHLLWVFVAAPVRVDWRTVHASTIWLAALVLPIAYWAFVGWPARRALPAVAGGVALVLLGVPALAGFPAPPPWEWIGAAAGVLGGRIARAARS